ncbi:type II toxin-antitoxin system RelE/ParE family toxin [bacterium]|nr:MAG: type II toxin-antitoxin system RelE/ParE family toxin [bacterium]
MGLGEIDSSIPFGFAAFPFDKGEHYINFSQFRQGKTYQFLCHNNYMKVFYINPDLHKYIHSFDKSTISKFTRLTDLLEQFGKKLGMPYSKKILGNLYELRIRGQQEVRIFYCFHKNQIVFVHAIIKKTQKTPQRDIKTALFKIKQLTNI